MDILKVENVTKCFDEGSVAVNALNGVSLSIEKGSFVAIIGRSGSGKTTLLNVISGLEPVNSGKVLFGNTDITKLGDGELSEFRRKRIGFVFQSFYLLPEFTVLENILIPIYLDNEDPDLSYVEGILETLNLTQKKNSFPNEISGGEQQRVAIARALSAKPRILFADEPTGNLDIKSGEEVMTLFTLVQRKFGQTIVLVTHDLSIARQADRIIKLEDGKIVEEMEA